jgi:hypothetical protein
MSIDTAMMMGANMVAMAKKPCHRCCRKRQIVLICDMASTTRPVSYRNKMQAQARACHQCGATFHSIRSDARYCSARCRKRAARMPLFKKGSPACDFDYEHDKDFDGEPASVTRARAVGWQLEEGERLTRDFALLRPGTEPHEISNKTLRGVRKVARAWATLWKELRSRQRGCRAFDETEASG